MAKEKVLVIDDEKNFLSMVGLILTGTECELINPQETDILAHEIFKHDCSLENAPCKKYKHVFSDFNYQIPGLNGLMVLKLIRAVPCLGQDIHLILATAGFPNDVIEAEVYHDMRELNITLLKKPFNVARLLSAMKII